MVSRGPMFFLRGRQDMERAFRWASFFLAGIMLMLAHHFLYTYLDGKPVDSYLFSIHGFSLSDQSVSSLLGNAIAYVARTVLSSGIGIVFIQVLWSKLRRKQFSVEHIDALVACKGEPFTLSALPTWHYAFWLAAIAAMATLMAFISIIAPGSLSVVSSNFSFPVQCTVRTISLENANIGSYAARTNSSDKGLVFAGAQARLMILASQVLRVVQRRSLRILVPAHVNMRLRSTHRSRVAVLSTRPLTTTHGSLHQTTTRLRYESGIPKLVRQSGYGLW